MTSPTQPESLSAKAPDEDEAARMRVHKRIEAMFTRNQYGLWCPNCGERIDEMWPVSCDCCGYPARDYTRFDGDDYD